MGKVVIIDYIIKDLSINNKLCRRFYNYFIKNEENTKKLYKYFEIPINDDLSIIL
jgi:hypothetical protein